MARNGSGWRGPQIVRNQAPPTSGAGNVPAPVPVQAAPPAGYPARPQAGPLVPSSVRMYEDLPDPLQVDLGEATPLPLTMFDSENQANIGAGMLPMGNRGGILTTVATPPPFTNAPAIMAHARPTYPAVTQAGHIAQAASVRPPPGFAPISAAEAAFRANEARVREWRKSFGVLHRRVSEISCLLGYVDQNPRPEERVPRIKERVEMFFEITKTVRSVIPWCTASCNQTVHDLMNKAEEQILLLNQSYAGQPSHILPTMQYVCSIMFRFYVHFFTHASHRAELAITNRTSESEVLTTFKLLYTFARDFNLIHPHERAWIQSNVEKL